MEILAKAVVWSLWGLHAVRGAGDLSVARGERVQGGGPEPTGEAPRKTDRRRPSFLLPRLSQGAALKSRCTSQLHRARGCSRADRRRVALPAGEADRAAAERACMSGSGRKRQVEARWRGGLAPLLVRVPMNLLPFTSCHS
eukprot:359622-Chlamydomonas_euryale.AAC.14